jgi:hypothetical protein
LKKTMWSIKTMCGIQRVAEAQGNYFLCFGKIFLFILLNNSHKVLYNSCGSHPA